MINIPLYQHQKEMVEWLKEHKSGLLAAKVGTGKTLTILSYFDYLKQEDKVDKLYVIGPINLLEDAWGGDISRYTGFTYCNLRKEKFNPEADIYLYNYESYWRKSGLEFKKQITNSGKTIIALDECFHGDTLIDTPYGKIPIKLIKEGDKVTNCTGVDTVTGTKVKKLYSWVKILYNRHEIKCSLNHPFLTTEGWKNAKDLKKGDKLLSTESSIEIVSGMRGNLLPIPQNCHGVSDTIKKKVLRDVLLSEMAYEATKHTEESIYRRKIQKGVKKIKFFRVDDIKVYKQRSDGGAGNCSEENLFYDLQVKNHPSFSVSGAVVHNCSKTKNNRSKVTKQIHKDISCYEYRVAASGTPAPNTELEYWSVCHFCKPGTLPTNFYVFRNNFFCLSRGTQVVSGNIGKGVAADMLKKGFTYQLHPRMKEEFKKRLGKCVIFVDNDVLDLPPQTDVIRSVDLTPKEKRVYKQMKDLCLAEIDSEVITAQNALTKVMKLRQATSGFLYAQDKEPKPIEKKPTKIKELLSIVEDSHEQMIIFSSFKHEIREVAKELSKIAPTTTAFSESEDTEQAIKDFKSGKAHYIVAHPLTIGHGVTLTNCQTIIFMSLDYSYELWEQTRGRTYRAGQAKPCTNIILSAKKSIDEIVYNAVAKKKDKQTLLEEFRYGSRTGDC